MSAYRLKRDKEIYKYWLKGLSTKGIIQAIWGTWVKGKLEDINHPFFTERAARTYVFRAIKRAKTRFNVKKKVK